MALPVFANRVFFQTATTGTGTLNVGAGLAGYQTPASANLPSGATTGYTLIDGAAWETGQGTLTAGTPWTLARDTVENSSAGGTTKISLSGNALVMLSPTALQMAALGTTFGGAAPDTALDINFLTGILDSRITFTRASANATYFDANGVMQTAGTNVPRFDFDPVTRAARGLLMEESRTNSIPNANTGAPGYASASSTDLPALLAGATLWKTTVPAGSANLGAQVNLPVTVGLAYAFSAWVWIPSAYSVAADGAPILNIDIGVAGTGYTATTGAADMTKRDQWQRVVSTLTPGTGASATVNLVLRRNLPNIGGSIFYHTCWQFEAGVSAIAGFATSYIPTTGSAATRAADVATMPAAPWYKSGAGSLTVDALKVMGPDSEGLVVLSLRKAATGDRTSINIMGGNLVAMWDTVPSLNLNFGAEPIGSVWRGAYAFINGAQAASLNGASIVTATAAPLTTGIDTLDIGNNGGGQQYNGYIRRARYWPRLLSTAELQQVSAATPSIVNAAIDQSPIGATTPSSGSFTTLSATGASTHVGPASFASGVSFGSQVASAPTDLSKHIALWSGQYGFSITSNRLNYEVGAGSAHFFQAGGVDVGYIAAAGLNAMVIGATTAAAGTFTSLTASGTVSGAGFNAYLASPPAIGGTTAAAGSFTTLTTASTATIGNDLTVGVNAQIFPARVILNTAAGYNRNVLYYTNGVFRWVVQADSTAESGANAGSNFAISGFSDAGAGLGNSVSINRASGLVSLPKGAAISGGSSTIDGAVIGGTTAAAGSFTTLSATGTATIATLNASGTSTHGGAASFANGVSFGSQVGASPTDLSKHIALFGSAYGFSITTSRLNYQSGSLHAFQVAGVDVANIGTNGLNATVIGASTPAAGSFTTLTASSTVQLTGSNKLQFFNSSLFAGSTGQDLAYFTANNLAIGSFQGIGLANSCFGANLMPGSLYSHFFNVRTGDHGHYGNSLSLGNQHWLGTLALSNAGATTTFAFNSNVASAPVVVAGGTSGFAVNDHLRDADNNIYQVSAVASGVISALTIWKVAPRFAAPPANPVTLTVADGVGAGTVTVNLTWSAVNAVAFNTAGATAFGSGSFANGVSFGSQTGSSPADLSKHIALYSTTFGFSVTGNRLNYEAAASASHFFQVNGVDAASISSTGLNATVIGATTPAAGTFTTLAATTITATNTITAGASGVGQVVLSPGNATQTGYLACFNAAGTRQGYFGYASGGNWVLNLESTTTTFSLSGAMTISGLLTASGGIANYYTAGTSDGRYLYKTGDTCTGALTVSGRLRTADAVMCDSGIFFVANNINYYVGRSGSDGYWRFVEGGATTFQISPGGNAQSTGSLTALGSRILSQGANNNPAIAIYNPSIGYAAGFWINTAPSAIQFGATDGAGNPSSTYGYLAAAGIAVYGTDTSVAVNGGANSLCWGNSSSFNVPGSAWKPGGGSWADSSDARIKDVLGDYDRGLDAILALRPVRYKFKDNWKRRGANEPQTLHRMAVEQDVTFIGLVAQETETVMPEMIGMIEAEIDGETVDDLRTLDMTALPLALVNAIKELTKRLKELTKRLETLEAQT